MKIYRWSSIITLQSRKLLLSLKLWPPCLSISSVVLWPRNFDNLTNKQLSEGIKLHLPLFDPIYSRRQNAGLGTFLYPCVLESLDFPKKLHILKSWMVSVSPPPRAKENLKEKPRYTTSTTFPIANSWAHTIILFCMVIKHPLSIGRLYDQILPLMSVLFIVIYWLTGLFVSYVMPQYEHHC